MRGFSLSVCLCVWPFHCNYTSSFWWKKFIWLVKLRLLLSLHPGASGWCGDGGNQNGKQTLNGSSSRGKPCLVRSGVRVCACMYTYKSLAWRVGTMTMTALKTRAGSRGEAAEAGKCWVGFQGCHGFLSHLLPCRRVWWRHPKGYPSWCVFACCALLHDWKLGSQKDVDVWGSASQQGGECELRCQICSSLVAAWGHLCLLHDVAGTGVSSPALLSPEHCTAN